MPTTTDELLAGILNYLDNRLEQKNTALDKSDISNDDHFRSRMLLKTECAELKVIRRALLEISQK